MFNEAGNQNLNEKFQVWRDRGIKLQTYIGQKNLYEAELLTDYEDTLSYIGEPEVFTSEGSENVISIDVVENFLKTKFQDDILKKALIEGIYLNFGTVIFKSGGDNLFGIEAGEYYIPKKDFLEILKFIPSNQLQIFLNNVYHAEAFANWNRVTDEESYGFLAQTVDSGNVMVTPIALYSIEFDINTAINNGTLNEEGIGYLARVPAEKRVELYILGLLSHEIGHHIYQHFIYQKELFQTLKKIVDQNGSVSDYAGSYSSEGDDFYEENFTESLRFYTTQIDYLKEINPQMVSFIQTNFPEIK